MTSVALAGGNVGRAAVAEVEKTGLLPFQLIAEQTARDLDEVIPLLPDVHVGKAVAGLRECDRGSCERRSLKSGRRWSGTVFGARLERRAVGSTVHQARSKPGSRGGRDVNGCCGSILVRDGRRMPHRITAEAAVR